MTLDDIKLKMVGLGFHFVPAGSGDMLVGSFFRPTETERVLHAGDKNYFEVELYDRFRFTRTAEPDRFAFDAQLTGEFEASCWCKLRAYSIRPEDFFERHKMYETALLKAWEAMKP